MAANYLDQVATVGFSFRLLKQWKGSLQKAIWQDLLRFLALFFTISFSYRYIITKEYYVSKENKEWFDSLCVYCRQSRAIIPISFLLGFYVTMVVERWWEQLSLLSSTESIAIHLASFIPGPGAPREVRRAIIRYASLSVVLTLQKMSLNVRQKFPDYSHLVDEGLLTVSEKLKLMKVDEATDGKYCNHMYPIKWAKGLLRTAFAKGLIVGNNDNFLSSLNQDCSHIYHKNMQLLRYSDVPFPLLYTQVIIIAVYTYFLACVFGNQHLTGDLDGTPHVYIPVFTILEFVCYVGWLKVGSALLNPFGDDDDDFDVDEIIEKNMKMGLLLVEEEDIELLNDIQFRNNPNLLNPNILISADWWETDWMIDRREPLRIRRASLDDPNCLEREAVKMNLSNIDKEKEQNMEETNYKNMEAVHKNLSNIEVANDLEEEAVKKNLPNMEEPKGQDKETVMMKLSNIEDANAQKRDAIGIQLPSVEEANALEVEALKIKLRNIEDPEAEAVKMKFWGEKSNRLSVPRRRSLVIPRSPMSSL